MTLKSQLYLLQLEEYNLERFNEWIRANPNKEVVEKKGKIKWTLKAKLLYFLGNFVNLETALKIFSPIDYLIKKSFVVLASLKLKIFFPKLTVIGIAGSWGKTTTKEKIAAMLSTKFNVYKTFGNHNTLLGVAGTILKMPLKTEIFVCEMGEYYPGDIKEICDLVKPKIGIITAVGPMHLERFKTMDILRKTLYEIHDFIKDGLKIGPEDNWEKIIADHFKVDLLKENIVVEHRQEEIKNNGITIIDDSYNSNPVGFQMALKKMVGKPKILVTPGMIEMGEMQFSENEKLAKIAAKICDYIIFVGTTNKKAWELACPKAIFAKDIDEAKIELSKLSKPGAVVLLENDLPDQYS